MDKLPFSKDLEEKISKIGAERMLGASEISDRCAEIYVCFANENETKTSIEFWDTLYALSKRLVWSQPDMASIFFLANHVLTAVRAEINLGRSMDRLREVLIETAKKAIQRTKTDHDKMNFLGTSLIEENDTILTHSHSSSVKDLFVAAHRMGKTFQVVVTESRPGLEGKLLAKELGRQGIVTTLIVEAAALGVLERCRKVFVGADRISEREFINKVGTRAIALGAKEKGIDFYVVCDTSKFVPARLGTFVRKQHPPEEVLDQRFPNVIVENPYFELIPLSLVTVVVCEKGLLPPGGVHEYLQETVHFPELLDP